MLHRHALFHDYARAALVTVLAIPPALLAPVLMPASGLHEFTSARASPDYDTSPSRRDNDLVDQNA